LHPTKKETGKTNLGGFEPSRKRENLPKNPKKPWKKEQQ
jgi:hypothetical protein